MRVEIWLTATGEGDVAPVALDAARALLGDDCLGVTSAQGEWRVGLAVEADSPRVASSAAAALVQAVALLAGLPDWPVTGYTAQGEPTTTEEDGCTVVRHQMSSRTSGRARFFRVDPEEGDDE